MVDCNSVVADAKNGNLEQIATFSKEIWFQKPFNHKELVKVSQKQTQKKSIFGSKAKNTDIYGKLKTHYPLQS